MPDLKVVELQSSNFRDIASTLRIIADKIEIGEYGNVRDCTLVLTGGLLEVFHLGGGDVTDAIFAMNLGIHKLCNPVVKMFAQD